MKKIFPLLLLLIISHTSLAQGSLSNLAQQEISAKNNFIDLEKQLDSLIQAEMAQQHIPGLAYVVVQNSNVILQKGYGFTSLGQDINYVNADSTIFRIGSITKNFTAFALMQLVDEGKIELHKDVNYYIDGLKVPATFEKPITPYHLLTHTSGLDELPGRRVFDPSAQIPLKEFLRTRLVRVREPGFIPAYSSYGMALAGLIVEEVSGVDLSTYFEQNIWEPLGMSSTSFGNVPESDKSRIAFGYEYSRGINIPQPWEYYHTYPASSINSTLPDMAKYMMMHLNSGYANGNRLLSRELTSKMHEIQIEPHIEIDGFGLGFFEAKIVDQQTIGHGGDMLGYSSYMSISTEQNLGVFVVQHHEGSNLRYKIMDKVFQHIAAVKEEDNFEKINISTSQLEIYQGNYQWASSCKSCDNKEKQLMELKIGIGGNIIWGGNEYYYTGNHLFISEDGRGRLAFKLNNEGEVLYLAQGQSAVFIKQ